MKNIDEQWLEQVKRYTIPIVALLLILSLIGYITWSHQRHAEAVASLFEDEHMVLVREDVTKSDVQAGKSHAEAMLPGLRNDYIDAINKADKQIEVQEQTQALFITSPDSATNTKNIPTEPQTSRRQQPITKQSTNDRASQVESTANLENASSSEVGLASSPSSKADKATVNEASELQGDSLPIVQADATSQAFQDNLILLKEAYPENSERYKSLAKLNQFGLEVTEEFDAANQELDDITLSMQEADLSEQANLIHTFENHYVYLHTQPIMTRVQERLTELSQGIIAEIEADPDPDSYKDSFVETVMASPTLYKQLRHTAFDPQKYAVLTFDDGPNVPYTQQVLEILKEYDVIGTFFVMGAYVDEHPEIVQQILDEGHILGNHTYNHLDLQTLSDAEILEQFEWTEIAIEEATGTRTDIYRLPFGSGNQHIIELLPNSESILWNVDTMDWATHDAEDICAQVESQAQKGFDLIILMHDTHEATPEALKTMIPMLKEMGFEFTTPYNVHYPIKYFES